MHQSVKDFVEEQIERLELLKPRIGYIHILEVGSYNVNGSVREFFPDDICDYVGIDIQSGPGVDLCTTIENVLPNSKDIVICTEMLEHDKFPWKTLTGIWEVLKTDGYLILTARGFNEDGAYPMHSVPDYWRFTRVGLSWLLTDLKFMILVCKEDPAAPGVFAVCRKKPVLPV